MTESFYRDGMIYRREAPRWIAERTVGDEEILTAWRDGKNTHEIGCLVGMPEHEVERRLHRAKDLAHGRSGGQ